MNLINDFINTSYQLIIMYISIGPFCASCNDLSKGCASEIQTMTKVKNLKGRLSQSLIDSALKILINIHHLPIEYKTEEVLSVSVCHAISNPGTVVIKLHRI